jgi:hypothetical protein
LRTPAGHGFHQLPLGGAHPLATADEAIEAPNGFVLREHRLEHRRKEPSLNDVHGV